MFRFGLEKMPVLLQSGTAAGRINRDEVDPGRTQRLNVGTSQLASPFGIPRVGVKSTTTSLPLHLDHIVTIGPKDPLGSVVYPREQAILDTPPKNSHPSPTPLPPT